MKSLHVGKLIKKVAKEKGVTDQHIADRINLTRQSVSASYSEKDMNTSKLRSFCEILEYDFFKALSDNLREDTMPVPHLQEDAGTYRFKELEAADTNVSVMLSLPKSKQSQILQLIFSA